MQKAHSDSGRLYLSLCRALDLSQRSFYKLLGYSRPCTKAQSRAAMHLSSILVSFFSSIFLQRQVLFHCLTPFLHFPSETHKIKAKNILVNGLGKEMCMNDPPTPVTIMRLAAGKYMWIYPR